MTSCRRLMSKRRREARLENKVNGCMLIRTLGLHSSHLGFEGYITSRLFILQKLVRLSGITCSHSCKMEIKV